MTYKGQIKDFPKEVVDKMLEYQVAQGNPKDVEVFENHKNADRREKGFTWERTAEGDPFWDNVIMKRFFIIFFQKYPKSETKLDETKQSEQWFEVGQTIYSHLFPEGEGVVTNIEKIGITVRDNVGQIYHFTLDGRSFDKAGIVISQTPLEPIKNKVIEKCPFEKGEWVAVKDENPESDWVIRKFDRLYRVNDYPYVTENGQYWQFCKKLSEFNI